MQGVTDQRFYRSSNRILGGVCAGLAEGFHVDPLWVRIAFLVLVFLQGVGVFIYIVLWLVMPERVEGGGERGGFNAMSADLNRLWGDVQRQIGGRPAPPTAAPAAPPPASETSTPPAQPQSAWRNQSVVLGLILVVIGLAVLGGNIGIINWSVVWPAALITLGIVILVRNLERRP
ncbi:MAG TPA: PspC domain-containing protein [Candidatus Nitrosopolaris sp.]|nr:PspC domain-containing protein [Candidatus Nitrosopolaris sp.]